MKLKNGQLRYKGQRPKWTVCVTTKGHLPQIKGVRYIERFYCDAIIAYGFLTCALYSCLCLPVPYCNLILVTGELMTHWWLEKQRNRNSWARRWEARLGSRKSSVASSVTTATMGGSSRAWVASEEVRTSRAWTMEFQSTATKGMVGVVCMITATPTISIFLGYSLRHGGFKKS